MPQSGLNKTRSPYLAVQFENVISSNFPSRRKMLSTLPATSTPLTNSIFAFRPSTIPSACNWSSVSNSGDADVCFHFPMRRTESILVIIDAVAFEFLVAERQCRLARCPQIDRRIVFVCDDFSENAADLQAGRILTGRGVLAFDCLVDSFESTNLDTPSCLQILRAQSQVLKIAADKKLRLSSCDVERRILRVDGVGDLLHLGLKT